MGMDNPFLTLKHQSVSTLGAWRITTAYVNGIFEYLKRSALQIKHNSGSFCQTCLFKLNLKTKHSADCCKLVHLQAIYKTHLQKTTKFTDSDLQQFTPDEAIYIYRLGIYNHFKETSKSGIMWGFCREK